MLDGLPRDLQQQALLWIDRGCLPLAHTEELIVEAGDVVEERTPFRHRATGYARLRIVVVVDVPASSRELADKVVTANQRVPQLRRRVDSPRKPACHPNHSNGGDR